MLRVENVFWNEISLEFFLCYLLSFENGHQGLYRKILKGFNVKYERALKGIIVFTLNVFCFDYQNFFNYVFSNFETRNL